MRPLSLLLLALPTLSLPLGTQLAEFCDPVEESIALFTQPLHLLFQGSATLSGRPYREDNQETRLLYTRNSQRSALPDFQVRRVRFARPAHQSQELRRLLHSVRYSIRTQNSGESLHLRLRHCFYSGNPRLNDPFDVFLVADAFALTMAPSHVGPLVNHGVSLKKKELPDRLAVYLQLAQELLAVHQSGFASYDISPQRVVSLASNLDAFRLNALWNLQRIGDPVSAFIPDYSDGEVTPTASVTDPVTPLNDIWALGMVFAELELGGQAIVGKLNFNSAKASATKHLTHSKGIWRYLESLQTPQDTPGSPPLAEDMEKELGLLPGQTRHLGPSQQVRCLWFRNIVDHWNARLGVGTPAFDFDQLVLRMIEVRRPARIQHMQTVVQWLKLLLRHKGVSSKDWKSFEEAHFGSVPPSLGSLCT